MRGTINVKYVNEPSDKGGASLTDVNKTRWYLGDDMDWQMFQVGGVYDVTYESKTSKAGNTYHKVHEVLADITNAPAGAAPPQAAPSPAAQAPLPAQAAAAQYAARPTPPADPQALNIFVTGIVGRSMGSGKFSPDQIYELTVAAREAYMKAMVS